MCELRSRREHSDAYAEFFAGRDVPDEVRAAAAGFDEYMNEHFGPPL
jgi:hypothetical protein